MLTTLPEKDSDDTTQSLRSINLFDKQDLFQYEKELLNALLSDENEQALNIQEIIDAAEMIYSKFTGYYTKNSYILI